MPRNCERISESGCRARRLARGQDVVIDGYAKRMTVSPGERLVLCVATTAPRFLVRMFRQGARFVAMPDGTFGWFEGLAAPPQPAGVPFGWPPCEIMIPNSWPPGAYVALLVEGFADHRPAVLSAAATPGDRTAGTIVDHLSEATGTRDLSDAGMPGGLSDPTPADSRTARALFVVRSLSSSASEVAPILYKLPTFTYHAYNVPDVAYAARERGRRGDGMDGQTYYTGTTVVSLERNGCGTGGTPWDAAHAPDVYDLATPRQTFAHWDAKFIAWLERNAYPVECCTDLDLHERDVDDLLRHRVIVSGGHDEYWSGAMRSNVAEYVARGGNVAFFAGNLLWWRVQVIDGGRAIERCDHFFERPGEEDSALTGVSYAHGGGHWIGERAATGFTVRDPDHWAFAGTGLALGETFGAERRLIGYECDGQLFAWNSLAPMGPQLAAPLGEPSYDDSFCVPANFRLLAYADIRGWPVDDASGEIRGNGSAAMGLYTNNGTVFTAATTDWPRLLAEGDPAVERITRNVLDRLGAC